jgi:gluconokinase
LLGERAPVWNASAQGVFFGVTAKHTSAHFHRAVLEGVLLNLCLIGQVLEETVAPVSRILADGGFTKMDFWVQMAADVFGKEVQTFESEDTPALGAVLIAMKSLGYIENFDLVKNRRRPLKTFHPNSENHRIYRQSLENFKEIYRLLEGKMAFGRNTVA